MRTAQAYGRAWQHSRGESLHTQSGKEMKLHLLVLRLKDGDTELGLTHVFDESGGTIGRSAACDLSIPDHSRTLSSMHAQISHNGHGFAITDTSTNGVYLNTVDAPLGRYKSAPLSDGDTLYLAEFVISVTVLRDEAEHAAGAGPAMGPASPTDRAFIPDEFDFGDLGAPRLAHPMKAGGEKPPVDAGAADVPYHEPASAPAHPPAPVVVGAALASLMAYSPWSRRDPLSAPTASSSDAPSASAFARDRDAQVFWEALGIDPALVAPPVREALLAGLGNALRDAARDLMAALPAVDGDATFAERRRPASPTSAPDTGDRALARAEAGPQPAGIPGMMGQAAA